MPKKFEKIKIYLHQGVLKFKVLKVFLLAIFLFLNVAILTSFCNHYNIHALDVQKIEKTQIEILKSKNVYSSLPPLQTTCIDFEHCCKHFLNDTRNIFTLEKFHCHQKNMYYPKTFILNKFVSAFFRPPIF